MQDYWNDVQIRLIYILDVLNLQAMCIEQKKHWTNLDIMMILIIDGVC